MSTKAPRLKKTIDNYGDPLLSITHFGREFEVYF